MLFWLAACTRQWEGSATWAPPAENYIAAPQTTPTPTVFATPTHPADQPWPTPTPDAPHTLPPLRAQETHYVIQPGDTLAILARRFQVSVEAIAKANHLSNINILSVGQPLVIPAPQPAATAPAFKILPDSELVASPSNATFDLRAFIARQPGFIRTYRETVEGEDLDAAAIIARVAGNYSVNPRLLLSLLEYQSHWLSQASPPPRAQKYPLGWNDPRREGLWKQLNWAANELNRGYYLWRVGGLGAFVLADSQLVRAQAAVNAATAGVQHFFALLDDLPSWQHDVGPQGLAATYRRLFGEPFAYALEPLLPPNLRQPAMQLPFEADVPWYFTGGPHGAWGDGSAWGALDFAPSDLPVGAGCQVSASWVTAVADGLVVRSDHGVVILDLDGDGYEQTGWAVLYLHIADQGRVPTGTFLHAGERIGHPSCTGGVANATHLHIARKYNGEWIPADRDLPWVLEGWVSEGAGRPYDGYLRRGDQVREACECRQPKNTLQHGR